MVILSSDLFTVGAPNRVHEGLDRHREAGAGCRGWASIRGEIGSARAVFLPEV